MAIYQLIEQNGQKVLSALLSELSSPLATSETAGAVKPDGVTTKVDSSGIISVLGGNLLYNRRLTVTESGEFTAPFGGWYRVIVIGGGGGGGGSGASYKNQQFDNTTMAAPGGANGSPSSAVTSTNASDGGNGGDGAVIVEYYDKNSEK